MKKKYKISDLLFQKKVKNDGELQIQHLLSEILEDKPTVAYPNFLLNGMLYLKYLKQIDDFSLNYSDGEWICHLEGLKFVLNSTEELYILKEVFIDGVYNIEINHPFIFIDIGMNVGITSLFFAKRSECEKVVAFEPVQPTLSMAKKNFAKNEMAQKIQVNETGLGYPARTVTVNYSEENKGHTGINSDVSFIAGIKGIKKEQLQITDVFEALKHIVHEKTVLKIDTEGSEYEILERLNNTGLLSRFDIIMIEWHIKGPSPLQKILLDNNFELLSTGKHSLKTGMIYAFKKCLV